MSHDQKPGKMRVVAGAAPVAHRRRGDLAADASQASSTPAATPSARKPALLLGILFVVGCAAGGAALPLTGWIG